MNSYQMGLIENIDKNITKMHDLLEVGNDRDSQLIDLVLHIETLIGNLRESS